MMITKISPMILPPICADLAGIGIFAAIGRSSHAEKITVAGVTDTAAPFCLGCLVGWGIWLLISYRPVDDMPRGNLWQWLSWRNFFIIWSAALVIGMSIRWIVKGFFPPVSFIIVAGTSLVIVCGIWRTAAWLGSRLRKTMS